MKTLNQALLVLALLFFLAPRAGAATYTLGITNLLEGPYAGTDSVAVAVSPISAGWTAATNNFWLHLSPTNQSGTGSMIVTFTFDANPGPTRTGTLTIGGQTLTLSQAGANYVAANTLSTNVSGIYAPYGIAVDGGGSVYFVDYTHYALRKWAVDGTLTTLIATNLYQPWGVALGGSGVAYIADSKNNAIKKLGADGNLTTLVSTNLNLPYGVALDGGGNVYIADTGNNAIKKWTVASNSLTTLVSGFNRPYGVAVDVAGNLYIADTWNNVVKKWAVADGSLTTLVSGLSHPGGVAVDGSGNVYIADSLHNTIKKWSAAGSNVTTVVSTGLSNPQSVALDPAGNLYISDTGNSMVKEWPRAFVDPASKVESAAAGSDVLPEVLPVSANLLAPFNPVSDQPWLSVTGITNGVVSLQFTASITNRSAHVILLGQTISLTQNGVAFFLASTHLVESPSAGNDSVVLTASSPLSTWTATSSNSWLHLTATNQSGTGSATVGFTFDANYGPLRIGVLSIAGQTLTVTQSAAAYVLGSTNVTEGAVAGSDSVSLSANLSWTATANDAWLHLSVTNQSGAGSAKVVFSFDANIGPPRTGTLTIAGQTLTVTQSGPVYQLGAVTLVEGPMAGSDRVGLTVTPAQGAWTASANAAWLHLIGTNQSGTGSGVVAFNFDTNPGPARTGTLTIAGQTLSVFQDAPTYLLGSTNLLEGPAAGSDSIVLSANFPWTASTNAAWLHLSSTNQSGTGSRTVVFSFDDNLGATRTGTLTIAGQTLCVTQAGASYVAASPLITLASGLNPPYGLALDGAGNVYVADSGNSAILKWTATNNQVATLVSAGLNSPSGLALDSAGNVYIADSGSGMVLKWTAATDVLTPLVSGGLNTPAGVAVDSSGNVYIADTGNSAIKEWMASNGQVTTLVSTGLNNPGGVAVDIAGNVYIADTGNSAVKEWMVGSSNVTTLVSSGLTMPQSVAVDARGNVYFTDSAASTVKEWMAVGTNVITLVSAGLNTPQGVGVDDAGNVYIADSITFAIEELPRAFVDPTAKSEGGFGGNDCMPPVLPATANLLDPFAPVSDQPWLTITGITNGIVRFAFTETLTNRTGTITLLGQSIEIAQTASAAVAVVAPVISGAQLGGNGVFSFAFSNNSAASFTVWSTTNPALPMANWTWAGTPTNQGSGLFNFSAPVSTNEPQRFYRVSSP